jgi:ABC-type Fe3+/spermidine/putrescine transport system ATPase subunit
MTMSQTDLQSRIETEDTQPAWGTADRSQTGETALEIDSLTREYGQETAVDSFSLTVQEGELLTLLGPSGCGKTTTLRMIAGLETPTEGVIHIAGEEVTDEPAYERDIGMVFQHYALFPHKTVGENVAFPLKMRGVPKAERREEAADALETVRLPGMLDRSPDELSGGQRQRVALARALVYEPAVLLMDEPLSALDRVLREQMRVELKRIQEEVGITTIYVTHDQLEAFSMSDRVIVLEGGRLSQEGPPIDIYENPASEFVADFIGQSSQLTGTVEIRDGRPVLAVAEGVSLGLPPDREYPDGAELTAFLRAEKVAVSGSPTGADNEMTATVTTMNYLGEKTQFFCDLADGQEVIATEHGFTGVERFDPGDTVHVSIDSTDVVTATSAGGPDGPEAAT